MAKKVIKEEIKEMTKEEKRNKMILICSIAVALVIVFVVVFCLTTRVSNKSLEDQLSDSLTLMGKEFYTEFYYVEISKNKSSTEISDNLSKFKDIGIKINLDNLSRYNDGVNKEEIAKFKNENGKACDIINTRAIIYPTSPYGQDDYTIKVELDCDFQTVEEK